MTTLLSNRPADPATLFGEELDDLMIEAKNFLDGKPIETEAEANAVSSLVNRLSRLWKDADETRKVEKRPHDDAAKAVQSRWLPILDKAKLAEKTAKQALAPYLVMVEEKMRRDAEILRENAAKLAEEAARAHRGASGNLDAAEQAEELLRASGEAAKEAARADKQKAHAKGGERAVGLRSYYVADITDPIAFGKWAWEHCRDDYLQFLAGLAEREARRGSNGIPGLQITEERRAV